MTKKILSALTSIAMLAGLTVQLVSAEAAKLGDVNTDGKVTVADVITLSRYAVEDTSLTLDDAALANADANYDGIVTAADCTSILRAIAGLGPLTDVPVSIDCLWLSVYPGGSFMHRDLLAITLPNTYINSDITYEVTNVDWIP